MVQLTYGLALVSIFLLTGATPWALSNSNCNNNCGNLTNIPFPFGIGSGCFLNEWYEIECRPQNKGEVLVPFLKKLDSQVLSITLRHSSPTASYIKVMLPTMAYRDGDDKFRKNAKVKSSLKGSPFFFSVSFNRFIVVGCNNMAMLGNTGTGEFAGCTPQCRDADFTTNGSCSRYSDCSSGINCCITSKFPRDIQELSVKFWNKENISSAVGEDCNYVFMFSDSSFDADRIDLHAMKKQDKFPVVLYWGVVEDLSISKDINVTSASRFGCLPTQVQYSSSEGEQYRQNRTRLVTCYCNDGYEGNPYTKNGCKDIDECKTGQHNCHTGTCVNRPGHYDCIVNKKMRFLAIGLGTGLGFLVFILFLWWIYKFTKKRKERKLKEKYFQKNGGLLLQQELYSINNNMENSKLFSLRELEVATSHFNVNRILGQGGGGTVYKGILPNGEIVAIKRSKVIDTEQVEQFINEIMILSQINHRNIVKLLGCCLETEIPLLVYEFISNGTLYDHVHTSDEENPISWEMRLQIAVDVAGALSYMHSTTQVPIYHRDIKSINILLDEKYRGKIADFGISRLVCLEKTHLTTLVQGTFGYLDPEYFQSGRYTDKSDVYSFGMVLVELLTGQKPISSVRERQGRSLATYFVHSIEDNLLIEITDPCILNQVGIDEIYKVGNLAYRCLNLDGSKRPTMKEVKMELEAIKRYKELSINITKEINEAIEPFGVNSLPSSFRQDVDRSSNIRSLTWSYTW